MKSSIRSVANDYPTPNHRRPNEPFHDAGFPQTCIIHDLEALDRSTAAGDNWPTVRGYEILTVIGSGGMGIVYKARHRELNRIVALKTLRCSALTDTEFRDRFRAEAGAVARLQHPNIIQVFEVGYVDAPSAEFASPFISLEFVDGGNLTKLTTKPQPPRAAAELMAKVARAVHAAHQVGIVHRDLKPANVLLTADGQPKVADFGLAKQMGTEIIRDGRQLTRAGMIVGTPEYMAPEQTKAAVPTPAIDVYAMGVILYELLTARVPFQASSPVETMNLVLQQEPVSPRRLQPGIPRDLETICLKCLEKDPSQRYESAEALANDLQSFLSDRPIEARRTSQLDRARRWCRRNPLLATTLVVAATIIFGAILSVSRSYWEVNRARIDALEREKAERWERYRAIIAASSSAMQVYDVDTARRHLDAAPSEYRDWEWRHLMNRLDLAFQIRDFDNSHSMLHRHYRAKQWMLMAGQDQSANLTHILDSTITRTIRAKSGWSSPVLTPDETAVVFRTNNGGLAFCDIESNRQLFEISTEDNPFDHWCFAADGKSIFTATPGMVIRQHSLDGGRLVKSIRLDCTGQMGWHIAPDDRHIGCRDPKNGIVRIFDFETGKQLAELPGHSAEIYAVEFSPDGKRVITVDGFPNNTVRLWDADTGRLIRSLGRHTNVITWVAFSNDGLQLATSSRDQKIRIWDGVDGRTIATLKGHNGPVMQIAFNADGKRLVSASEDHTLRLWDTQTGEQVAVLFGHLKDVQSALFTNDGKYILSCSADRTQRIWNANGADKRDILNGHTSFVYGVAIHPDQVRVASTSWDGTARIWDSTTGKQLLKLDHPAGVIVTSVAFHPSGKLLATRARDAVRLWDVESGKQLHIWPVPVNAWHDTNLAFSHKGDHIAAGCTSNEIRVWNWVDQTEIVLQQQGGADIRDVAFSPDDKFIAGSTDDGDCSIRIWDLAKKEVARTLKGHSQGVFSVAYNEKGTMFASSSIDGTVRLWDTATWKELAVLRHPTRVYGVAFNREGTRLVCGCADNSIRLWDCRTYQEVVNIRGHTAYIYRVAFSHDGNRLFSGSGDGTIRIWNAEPIAASKQNR